MQNELIEQWTKLNHDNVEVIKQFSENYARAMTYLTQRQMEMVDLYLEASAKQLAALSQAKNVPDLITAQSRLFANFHEKLMDNARWTFGVLTFLEDIGPKKPKKPTANPE